MALAMHSTRGNSTLSLSGSRAPSATGSRPGSATRKHGYKQISTESTVDETLFGSGGNTKGARLGSDWSGNDKSKPMLYWKASPSPQTDNQAIPSSVASARSQVSMLPDTARSATSGRGTPRKHVYKKLKHTPTFVDETLFGPKIPAPDFPAPWETPGQNKPKPFWYDPTDYRAKAAEEGTPRSAHGMPSHRPLSVASRPPSGGGFYTHRPDSAFSGFMSARPDSRQMSHRPASGTKKTMSTNSLANRPVWK